MKQTSIIFLLLTLSFSNMAWGQKQEETCYQLVLLSANSSTTIPLPTEPGSTLTIGRRAPSKANASNQCFYVIEATTVSKRHCRLTLEDGCWKLQDLRSTNGTQYTRAGELQPKVVSSQKEKSLILQNGNTFAIGLKTFFRFEVAQREPKTTPEKFPDERQDLLPPQETLPPNPLEKSTDMPEQSLPPTAPRVTQSTRKRFNRNQNLLPTL